MTPPVPRELLRIPGAPRRMTLRKKAWRGLVGAFLAPVYCILAAGVGTPGLSFRLRSASLGLRLFAAGRISFSAAYHLLFMPLDSTRYFEFDFLWRAASRVGMGSRLLDVSSPRLFPLFLLAARKVAYAHLLNPDRPDLEVTQQMAAAAGVDAQCRFDARLITEVDLPPSSFDVVTSMSVIEHIPADTDAVRRMWELLRPGGRLLISVPCAPTPREQYRDFDEYHLLEQEADGTVFFQRFYDDAALADRIFSVTGAPTSSAIYGERAAGLFRANANAKLGDQNYPFWREPFMMGREYRYFHRIADLPGEGVIAMEFVKR